MAWLAILLSVALLGVSGLFLLQRLRVYSILLLVLSFFGLSLMFSYSAMSLSDQHAAERSIGVFAVGTVVLLASFAVLEHLFRYALKKSQEIWVWRFDNCMREHLIYSGIFLIGSLLIFLLFREDFSANWEDVRTETVAMLPVATFLMFLGCPGLVSAGRKGKGIFLIFLVVTISVFVLSGSRAGVLTALAMYAWYWLAGRRKITFNLRTIIAFTLLVAAVFTVHAVLRSLRSFSPADVVAMFVAGDFSGITAAVVRGFADGGVGGSESSIAEYLVFSTSVADENYYGTLTSLVRTLTLFMPSTFFHDKPTDVTYLLWADAFAHGLFDNSPYYHVLAEGYATGVMGSLHPTFFGELFLSGEWVGLFIGIVFFACVCMAIDLLLLKMKPRNALLLIGPSIVGMAMIARGNSVIGVGYFFYLLPIVLFTTCSVNAFANLCRDTRCENSTVG